MSDLISNIGTQFTRISNKLTERYQGVYGLLCDLYLPVNPPNPNEDGTYDNINIFATHGVVHFNSAPDAQRTFYIPFLLKKEIMNSSEDSFDTFYNDEGEYAQPYIECAYKDELPIMSKVAVHIGTVVLYLMVERKTVVALGGNEGHSLLRQYLIPMTGELPNV